MLRLLAVILNATLGLGLLLAACADGPPPSEPMPRGAEVMPPTGWIDYCMRTPDDCEWTRHP